MPFDRPADRPSERRSPARDRCPAAHAAELKDALDGRAAERRQNVNDLIVGTLSERLGLATERNQWPRTTDRTNGKTPRERTRSASRSSASATAPTRSSRACSTTRTRARTTPSPGLMHVDLGGYHIRDIEFVAAFDVVKGKVGVDLADAIWAHPNDTIKFADVPKTGVTVIARDDARRHRQVPVRGRREGAGRDRRRRRHPQGDATPTSSSTTFPSAPRRRPSGTRSRSSTPAVAMVNCMPVFIAREPYWQRRFEEAGVPIIGDDIKSQVGATISHRVLTTLFRDRGVHLDRTMQLNVGGNSDFLNMLERDRLESKKISKTNAVTSMLDYDIGAGQRPRRPVRLRAVADRPQVGVHPHGGQVVRRRAAEHRAEARGLGLARTRRASSSTPSASPSWR